MSNEYIYAGNLRVAIIQSGSTYYWHNDHLSPRVRTDSSGNIADQRGTFPFGETWYTPNSSAPWMFTTYYRDVEAEGNDYAQARTYVGGLGRFSSPDPVAGSTSDPQSLNRYSYVRNMPHMLTDPFGLCPGGVAQNRDNDQSSPDQATKGSGPWISDEAADPQQNGPPPWNSCQGFTDQSGSGGGISIDGGEAFNPGDGAWGLTGIGTDAFSLIGEAFTPTSYLSQPNPDFGTPDCPPDDCGEPETISEAVYGNLGLLSLLGGPGGGGAAKKYGVNLKVLNDCLAKMGIKTTITSFVPSTSGGFGQASGTGEDAFTGHGNTVPITVANDASSFNYAQIGQLCKVPGGAYGCTIRTQPYTNYTNNNNSAFGTVDTQVWELGNSLTSIQAGSIFVPIPVGANEPGNILEKCVTAAHGIQPQ